MDDTTALGSELWEMQSPKHRELGGMENTIRLVRIEFECQTINAYQLRQLMDRLRELKPVPKFLRELVEAAAKLDSVRPAMTKLFVPLWDLQHCAAIAAQHDCECAGTGMVSRRVAHEWYPRGYSVAYACKCPVGVEFARVTDRRSVRDWEERYGAQPGIPIGLAR